jgi:acetyl-CoA acetyltransferase
MIMHPFREVAIAGAYNTQQALSLESHTSVTISLEATLGVLEETGVARSQVDGVIGQYADELVYLLGIGPVWQSMTVLGIRAILEAAQAIACGVCETIVVAAGGASIYTERASTAPWTRPSNEFVISCGMYTAVEFALIARRHMEMYGTRPEHLAKVASIIRNNGHVNPEAVYYGRGPYTIEDILSSRMVADPFHLLDCSMTAEGGCAVLLTTVERAKDLRRSPVYVLGGGVDQLGPAYQHPPSWDLRSFDGGTPDGYIGRRAARQAFSMAGLSPDDVDVCELYDPFSFEIIRQLEAFEFCKEGDGAEYVMEGNLDPGGRHPVTTDGGLMSFSHGGGSVQLVQRVVRAIQQLQGTCATRQVADAGVALASNGGAGALFTDVVLLGRDEP